MILGPQAPAARNPGHEPEGDKMGVPFERAQFHGQFVELVREAEWQLSCVRVSTSASKVFVLRSDEAHSLGDRLRIDRPAVHPDWRWGRLPF